MRVYHFYLISDDNKIGECFYRCGSMTVKEALINFFCAIDDAELDVDLESLRYAMFCDESIDIKGASLVLPEGCESL